MAVYFRWKTTLLALSRIIWEIFYFSTTVNHISSYDSFNYLHKKAVTNCFGLEQS